MSERRSVILISADSEWRAVKEILAPTVIHSTSIGEYFDNLPVPLPHEDNKSDWSQRFFHTGWGKISSAAGVQYAIDQWRPDLLVNLGTCGGFEGCIARGTIILVTRTIVYDILEQMSDLNEAISHYSTELDLSWLCVSYPQQVQPGLLVSADRDIVIEDIPGLIKKYAAVAADWESGAIAWVAKKNSIRCLILRGVSDLVGPSGGETYGDIQLFHANTKKIMKELLGKLSEWLNACQTETP